MTPHVRKIDRWFPIDAVDEACGNAIGSGLVEKQLMTWFASRPIAQARAAVLTALLPDANGETQRLIDIAVRGYDRQGREPGSGGEEIAFSDAVENLAARIAEQFPDGPVVLDPFSGRGIIPLEATRFGAKAIGTDLAPLAVLASRLLADYPYRDWDDEPDLPAEWLRQTDNSEDPQGTLVIDDPHEEDGRDKLTRDVEAFLREVGRRFRDAAAPYYPPGPDGTEAWGYIWAVTIPCDQCQRRFPLLGRLELRHPKNKTDDPGQSLHLDTAGDDFTARVVDGSPTQGPTFTGGARGTARCLFCKHVHKLDAVKAKGFDGQYEDRLLAVAELGGQGQPPKVFRDATEEDHAGVKAAEAFEPERLGAITEFPDEPIPPGNNDTVRPSGYGYRTYGDVMCRRQSVQFALLARAIRELAELIVEDHGASASYAQALASYATATMVRRIMRSTRGATLEVHGNAAGSGHNSNKVQNIYANESAIAFGFDFFEVGIAEGPGTWDSVAFNASKGLMNAVGSLASTDRKIKDVGRFQHDWRSTAAPGKFRQTSATALPLRDQSVDVIVTDPPYYNMIDYSDASDIHFVWARRALYDIMPDLFGPSAVALQPKNDEIIVKRGTTRPEEHRTKPWYHEQLANAFGEMKRVLKDDGHLTVVFGHHDPDAWVRLLGALRDAGFVVTSSWPSRTESGNTGVASIKVTVSIGCRVAPEGRPDGLMNQVDIEIRNEVASRVKRWSDDGLALPDQLMAAYGPAMEVYGRYASVLQPNGEPVDLERYLLLSRAVVKDTVAMKVDELPLETFDAETRLAVAWLRFYGHTVVQKGEARFMAQTEAIRIDEVRDLFVESKNGFKLNTDPTDVTVTERTPAFALVLAMCARMAGDTDRDLVGVDGAASVLAAAESTGALSKASDPHLWAVVSELHQKLADSSKTGKALARVVRSKQQIINAADRGRSKIAQEVDRDLAQQALDLTGDDG